MRMLFTLFMLGIVILIHELGHYAAMKASGVQVEELAIGFGPTVYSATFDDGTVLNLKPFPLGGYTKPAEHAMEDATLGARIVILFAGMWINVFAAIVALTALCCLKNGEPLFIRHRLPWLPARIRPLVMGIVTPIGIWLATPPLAVWSIYTRERNYLAGFGDPSETIRHGQETPSFFRGALLFCVAFNAGIAGFNLLPLVPLDGGRIACLLIGVFNPEAAKVYGAGSMIAFVLLLGLYIAFGFRHPHP